MKIEECLVEKYAMELMDKADDIIKGTLNKVKYEVILMYWSLGKMVCEYKEKNNSKYGDAVIKRFSELLFLNRGVGFGATNIESGINFYRLFRNPPTSGNFENITWSHCREIVNLKEKEKVFFYLNEVKDKNYTVKELRRSLKTKSFDRTLTNQQEGKINHPIEKTLKDPIIGKGKGKNKSEKQLEDEIINNLADFKNELGNVVTFLGRQHKINVNGLTHKVDLVFLDYETNTFILIDLKVNKVSNKDIHQMQMYIKHFSNDKRYEGANVVGLILCETKDVRLEEDDNIYQIKYLSEMPKESELLKIIEENKVILLKTENLKDK